MARQKSGIGCGGYAIGVLIGVSFIWTCSIITDPPKTTPTPAKETPPPYGELEPFWITKQFVLDQLKSPSTAKWPSSIEYADHITALGDDRFRINSWVDSQNGFGAQIRTKFTATVKFSGGGKWTLESLDFR